MRITFVTRKFGNVERNSHCDVLHITPIRVARLFLDCNGDFAIKAYALMIGCKNPKQNLDRAHPTHPNAPWRFHVGANEFKHVGLFHIEYRVEQLMLGHMFNIINGNAPTYLLSGINMNQLGRSKGIIMCYSESKKFWTNVIPISRGMPLE